MEKLFIIAFLSFLIGCKAQENNKVIVKINNRNYYYYNNEKLMALVFSKKDSISFKYKDSLIIKIEKFNVGKLMSEVDFVYDKSNKIPDNFVFTEDYYDYYEKFYTRIPYKNKYKLLDRDFVYIDAILDQDRKKYNSNKKTSKIFEFKLDKNVQMLNAKFSPFVYGTVLKNLKLYVVNNFLVELDATFIEDLDEKIIIYKKYYEYDKEGRLSSSKTINVTSGEIEDSDKIEYKDLQ